MNEIAVKVETAAAIQRLGRYGLALRERLARTIRSAANQLRAAVRTNELSGGLLQERTGRLKRSIRVRVRREGDVTRAEVFPGTRYGFMWIHGTPKNETFVREHARRVEGAGLATVAYRRRTRRGKVTQYVEQREGAVRVKAHPRKLEGFRRSRPFMGRAFARVRASIEDRLRQAYAEAAAQVEGRP